MKRGPYESKDPAGTPRTYRGRMIVCSPPCYLGFGTVRQCPNMCKGECGYKPQPETNFVTALVKAFVKDKLKRQRKG